VPTAPPQKIPNTKLLLTFEEVTAVDNTTNTYADAPILSTAQKAYRSSSFYFNGSTYFQLKSNLLKYILPSQDYPPYQNPFSSIIPTEPWALSLRFYPLSVTTARGIFGIGGNPLDDSIENARFNDFGVGVSTNPNGGLTLTVGKTPTNFVTSTATTSNNILLVNTWHTLLVYQDGLGIIRMSVSGGSAVGSATSIIGSYLPQPNATFVYIGQGYYNPSLAVNPSFGNPFFGYIDEVKFVKGATAPPGSITSVGWADK
jgi:hypothetical protein